MNRFRQPRFEVLSRSTGPRLISILSGKGGVGKSVIAFNLAERLAHAGHKTLVVDADIACGNLHILGNVNPKHGLAEFVDGRVTLADAAQSTADRLFLLPSISDGPADSLSTADVAVQTVKRLRDEGRDFQFIIIDHSSGVSETATLMAHGSDLNILVLIPELTSISDCYGLFKYLLRANSSIDCSLLLNRVESGEEAEFIRAKFSAMADMFLGRVPGYLGAVHESTGFRQAVARQSAVALAAPQDQSLQDLTIISRSLVELLGTPLYAAGANQENEINKTPVTADTRG
jgi:flagellar biosynthesis protein FlhG